MKKNILLVEPMYKNKYPPLGLMKISAYHKQNWDEVTFVKGKNLELKKKKWDRIYVTTLFTFYWKTTIDTIKYYLKSVESPKDVFVGGILATLLYDDLLNEPGLENITINTGLLDKPEILGDDNVIVDTITPDYDIIDSMKNKYLDYKYPVENAYITSTTKGCIRKCKFCAVKTLEPQYCDYIDIKQQIHNINKWYGPKRDMLLMDNNILASNSLSKIVDDLVELGFDKGNKSYEKNTGKRVIHLTRHIDFNQGTDARLLNEEIMQQLARLEVKPLRIAFDHADPESIEIYVTAQRLAAKYKVKTLSNYILFNFEDAPEDLYVRLRINVELNEEFKKQGYETSIWSFPMKYMPISGEYSKGRKYIGTQWNKKQLRGVQCILNATHAVVGPKKDFFEHAFGKNVGEFERIIYLPEYMIINRVECENNGKIDRWNELFMHLTKENKRKFINLIKDNEFLEKDIIESDIKELYSMYL